MKKKLSHLHPIFQTKRMTNILFFHGTFLADRYNMITNYYFFIIDISYTEIPSLTAMAGVLPGIPVSRTIHSLKTHNNHYIKIDNK